MIYENQRLLRRLSAVFDMALVFISLPAAFFLRFYVLQGGVASVGLGDYIVLAAIYAPAETLVLALAGLYSEGGRGGTRSDILAVALISAGGFIVLMGVLFLSHFDHYSRLTLLIFIVLQAALLALRRLITLPKGDRRRRVLLLGGGELAARYVREAENSAFEVAGQLEGGYDALSEKLEELRPDEVVAALEPDEIQFTPKVIAACEKAGVRLSIIPFYAAYMVSKPHMDEFNGIPLLNLREIPLDNLAAAAIKRTADVIGSAILLILSLPIIAVCAVGVRISSPGPVFFKQERLGRDNRPFMIYKLRTMRQGGDADTGWSTQNDPRRTRFGAFLRKFSIDELPQFWNVLRGDMSLVGPRPELPYHVEHFREEIPLYMVRQQVRPGITGWAQVNGLRGDTSIRSRVEYDIYYIEHWSPRLDIEILWDTLFRGRFISTEE